MRRSRVALLIASCAIVLLLAGGGLALRVGASEGAYREVVVFSQVLSLILDNYVDPVEADRLLRGAFEQMLGSLDPHGTYLTPDEVRAWKEGAPAEPGVTGLSFVKAHGSLQVVTVAPGSPAETAGLERGDQIRQIDGRRVRDFSLAQLSTMLRGEPGSVVELDVFHSRRGFQRETVEVVRAVDASPTYRLRVDSGIGVLELLDLARIGIPELEDEIEAVRSRGVDKLMIDVRNLTSGSPQDAGAVLDLFATGPLFRLKDRSGKVTGKVDSRRSSVTWTGPVAILVNGATAGGGEGLAASLRSVRGATVYGESSFGLGTEPSLFELPDGSGLLVSTGIWETVTGEDWNGEGVAPDLVLEGKGSPEEVHADQLRRALDAFAEDPSGAATERKAA
jgi:carboxyl-terminal processing protease